jgi:LCP family protein required for cell wall assembly
MHSPDDYLRQIEEEEARRQQELGGRSPWRWVKRFFLGLFAIVLVAAVALGWFGTHTLKGVSSKPFDPSPLTTDAESRTNILILGVGDPGHAGQDLSDSIMVVSINRQTKQVATISIPRDTEARIPGYGYRKINNANALGGSELAKQTVSGLLGIPIDYTIVTNFSGLKNLVDAVGGIDVNVKEALVDNEYPCADNEYKSCGINIQPGLQHMDGARALEYTRCRKGTCGNDFGRAERQQEVINLLMAKLVQPRAWINPVSAAAVSNALRTGITTDLSGPNMVRLAWAWSHKAGEPTRWVLSTAPGGLLTSSGSSTNLVPVGGDYTAIQEQAANIFTNPPKQDKL